MKRVRVTISTLILCVTFVSCQDSIGQKNANTAIDTNNSDNHFETSTSPNLDDSETKLNNQVVMSGRLIASSPTLTKSTTSTASSTKTTSSTNTKTDTDTSILVEVPQCEPGSLKITSGDILFRSMKSPKEKVMLSLKDLKLKMEVNTLYFTDPEDLTEYKFEFSSPNSIPTLYKQNRISSFQSTRRIILRWIKMDLTDKAVFLHWKLADRNSIQKYAKFTADQGELKLYGKLVHGGEYLIKFTYDKDKDRDTEYEVLRAQYIPTRKSISIVHYKSELARPVRPKAQAYELSGLKRSVEYGCLEDDFH